MSGTYPTVMLRLEQIETDPDNVFRHEDGDLQRLVGAIHSFGFLAAITVDADSVTVKDGVETYRLVGGEARVEAARAAGLTEIPATLATFESREARTAAGIALNAHFGHFDDAALSSVLRDLRRSNYDLDLTALMPGQLDDLLGSLETMPNDVTAPDDFPSYGDDIDVQYHCPRCQYEWSGKSK